MKPSTKAGIAGLAALALLTAVHQLREADLALPAAGQLAIGILPNLAAAIAITFVLLSIWLDQKPGMALAEAKRPFLICAAISGAGLFGWEFFQMTSSRLVFDPADLLATLAGLGIAALLFTRLWRTG